MITIDNTHDIHIKNKKKTKEHIFKLVINEYVFKNRIKYTCENFSSIRTNKHNIFLQSTYQRSNTLSA